MREKSREMKDRKRFILIVGQKDYRGEAEENRKSRKGT